MLVELKQAPLSSKWNFHGVKKGFEVWTSQNGKTFFKRDGKWFKNQPAK